MPVKQVRIERENVGQLFLQADGGLPGPGELIIVRHNGDGLRLQRHLARQNVSGTDAARWIFNKPGATIIQIVIDDLVLTVDELLLQVRLVPWAAEEYSGTATDHEIVFVVRHPGKPNP